MMEVVFPIMDIGTTVTIKQPEFFTETDIRYQNFRGRNELIIDQSAVNYFKLLIRKYKKQMGDMENSNVCSGGLQQYLIRQKDKNHGISTGQAQSQFESLPVSMICQIRTDFIYGKCSVTLICWYQTILILYQIKPSLTKKKRYFLSIHYKFNSLYSLFNSI